MTTRTDIGPGGAAQLGGLVGEVVEWLRPRPGACLVDATVGLGGHAAALLAAAPGARLLGLDRDRAALARAAERLPDERVVLRQARFGELAAVLAEFGWDGADAVLLDLGVSSLQLDDPARGFSFRVDAPLDMRMDAGSDPSAAEIVNQWPERELAYPSLEARRVKDAFRRWAADCLCPPRTPRCVCGWSAKVRLLTRRPLRPSAREVARNPRARSARLRIVERLEERA